MERSKRKKKEVVQKRSLGKKERIVEKGVKKTLQEGGFLVDAMLIFGMARGLAGQMKGGPFRAMFDKYAAKKDFERYISSFKRDGGVLKYPAREPGMLHHSKMLDLAEILKDHIPYSILYEMLLLQDSFWLTTEDSDRFNDWIDVVLPTAHLLIYIDDKYTRQIQYYNYKKEEAKGDEESGYLSVTSYLNAIRKVTYMYQKAQKDGGKNINNWNERSRVSIISAIDQLFKKLGPLDGLNYKKTTSYELWQKRQELEGMLRGKFGLAVTKPEQSGTSMVDKTINIIVELLVSLFSKKKKVEGKDMDLPPSDGDTTWPRKMENLLDKKKFIPIQLLGEETVYKYKARVFTLKEIIEEGILDRVDLGEGDKDKGHTEKKEVHNQSKYDKLMVDIFNDVESEYNKYNLLFEIYQQFINIDGQFSIIKPIFREYTKCDPKLHILTDSNTVHNTINKILQQNDGMKYRKENISMMSQFVAVGLTAGLIAAAVGVDTSLITEQAGDVAGALELLSGGAQQALVPSGTPAEEAEKIRAAQRERYKKHQEKVAEEAQEEVVAAAAAPEEAVADAPPPQPSRKPMDFADTVLEEYRSHLINKADARSKAFRDRMELVIASRSGDPVFGEKSQLINVTFKHINEGGEEITAKCKLHDLVLYDNEVEVDRIKFPKEHLFVVINGYFVPLERHFFVGNHEATLKSISDIDLDETAKRKLSEMATKVSIGEKEHFEAIDADNDGRISQEELKAYVRTQPGLSNIPGLDEKITRLFTEMDSDKDGSIVIEEYQRTVVQLEVFLKELASGTESPGAVEEKGLSIGTLNPEAWEKQIINCHSSHGMTPFIDSELNMTIYVIDFQNRSRYQKYMFKREVVYGTIKVKVDTDDTKLKNFIQGGTVFYDFLNSHKTYYYDLVSFDDGWGKPHDLVLENKIMKTSSEGASLYAKLKEVSSDKLIEGIQDLEQGLLYVIYNVLSEKQIELALKYNDYLMVFPKNVGLSEKHKALSRRLLDAASASQTEQRLKFEVSQLTDWRREKNYNEIDSEVLIQMAIILGEMKHIIGMNSQITALLRENLEATKQDGNDWSGGVYLLSKCDKKTLLINLLLGNPAINGAIKGLVDETTPLDDNTPGEKFLSDPNIKDMEKAPGFLYSTWLGLSYRSIIDYNFRGMTGSISKGILNSIGMSRKQRTDMRTIEELLEQTFMSISKNVNLGYTTFLIKKGIPPCLMGRFLRPVIDNLNIDGVDVSSITDFMMDDPDEGQEDVMMRKYYIDTIENHYVGVKAPECKRHFCQQGTDYVSRTHKGVRLPLFKHLFPNQENKYIDDSLIVDYTVSCNDILYILPYIRNNCQDIDYTMTYQFLSNLNEKLFKNVVDGLIYLDQSGKNELSQYISDIYENNEWLLEAAEESEAWARVQEKASGVKTEIINRIKSINTNTSTNPIVKYNKKNVYNAINESLEEIPCFRKRKDHISAKINKILETRFSGLIHSKLDKIMEGYEDEEYGTGEMEPPARATSKSDLGRLNTLLIPKLRPEIISGKSAPPKWLEESLRDAKDAHTETLAPRPLVPVGQRMDNLLSMDDLLGMDDVRIAQSIEKARRASRSNLSTQTEDSLPLIKSLEKLGVFGRRYRPGPLNEVKNVQKHYLTVADTTIREGRGQETEELGEYKKDDLIDVVMEGTDTEGKTVLLSVTPTLEAPDGGWVNKKTSKGEDLVEVKEGQYLVVAPTTIRKGLEQGTDKLGEYKKGDRIDVVKKSTDSEGRTVMLSVTPTPGAPDGGWVKAKTSKGKVLLDVVDVPGPRRQPPAGPGTAGFDKAITATKEDGAKAIIESRKATARISLYVQDISILSMKNHDEGVLRRELGRYPEGFLASLVLASGVSESDMAVVLMHVRSTPLPKKISVPCILQCNYKDGDAFYPIGSLVEVSLENKLNENSTKYSIEITSLKEYNYTSAPPPPSGGAGHGQRRGRQSPPRDPKHKPLLAPAMEAANRALQRGVDFVGEAVVGSIDQADLRRPGGLDAWRVSAQTTKTSPSDSPSDPLIIQCPILSTISTGFNNAEKKYFDQLLEYLDYGHQDIDNFDDLKSLTLDGKVFVNTEKIHQMKIMIGNSAMGTLPALAGDEITKIGLGFAAFIATGMGGEQDYDAARAAAAAAEYS